MAKLVDIQGRFPCEPDNKKPTLIKKWEYSTALYPPNNAFTSDNTFTLVTTDTFMLGIYELGPGGVFAPLDIHPGDESYYILNGPVVQRSGNGQFAYLETGEGLFMPEGAWHCCHNFSDQKTSHQKHGMSIFHQQSFQQKKKQNSTKDQTMIICQI